MLLLMLLLCQEVDGCGAVSGTRRWLHGKATRETTHELLASTLERLRVLPERVHQPDRLAVGGRQNHVSGGANAPHDVIGAPGRQEPA